MRTLHRRFLGAVALALFASLTTAIVALGQDGEEVIISDTLEPTRLEVSAGTVVTWRNDDGERHRMRSRQGPAGFDTGNLEPGERASVTFVVAGESPYIDERNDEDSSYFGTIIVVDEQPTGGPPQMEATVARIDESYQSPALEVAVGATVTWENVDGDDDHTVTSTDGAFDSGVLPAGSAFEQSFDAPGTYPYFCAIHPEMEGTITVVGDVQAPSGGVAGESPSPAESAAPLESAVPIESTAPVESPATGGATPGGGTAAEAAAVTIVDLAFEPATIEVDAGTTVTWANDDSVPHTVTARDEDFDSGVMLGGDSFSQTFESPGSYEYFCAIHPSMTGMVTVTP